MILKTTWMTWGSESERGFLYEQIFGDATYFVTYTGNDLHDDFHVNCSEIKGIII